jgi:hypothetical protein
MAIKTTHVLYDDLDGSTDEVGTYRFALEGAAYEIDLSPHNFDRMAAAFAPFITAGRRLPKTATNKAASRGASRPSNRVRNAQLRQWWTTHWQEHQLLAPRTHGAIPQAVRDAYDAAH